jgi:polysaccharide export outer membrane protein
MRWHQLIFVVLALPLAACSVNGKVSTYPAEVRAPYALDAGDVVQVSVYGDESLSKIYKVDDAGTIAVPLIGTVPVRGLTTRGAAGAIAAKLAAYMRSPSVTVEMDTYRPFFIQGAVRAAGQFTYVPGMTVRAAVSTAGGYADSANRSRAVIYRRDGENVVQSGVDLDYPIHPGDTIVIAERWL